MYDDDDNDECPSCHCYTCCCDEDEDDEEMTESEDKYNVLVNKIRQKIIDLQAQIITAYTDKSSAIADNPNDVLRYTAMVDVLKAMLN